MKIEDKLNWNLIENSNNLICVTELDQAKFLLHAAICRGRNYDVKDLQKYIDNTSWYYNFGNKTKMRYVIYGNQATFSYGVNECNIYKILKFEDVFVNEQYKKAI